MEDAKPIDEPRGKPFTPEHLARDFGANETAIALRGVRALYDAIVATVHPRAQTSFKKWKAHFAEVSGRDLDDPSDTMLKLADAYGIARAGIDPAGLLFALHSYYALFMKLLATEIVASFNKLPTPCEKMLHALTTQEFRRECEDLENGNIFRQWKIANFLEDDLFAWYTSVWSDAIERMVRTLVSRLREYDPDTLRDNPATSPDLLKQLYQELFPRSVRHDLGEYYTPDWLADHVLNEIGYEGDSTKRLLDPACGSGTFLVKAINRIRARYDESREHGPYDKGDLCRKILRNVIGFDLNPLAVMAAHTNYLIAIHDLVGSADKIEIPVYRRDSIMAPHFAGTFDFVVGNPPWINWENLPKDYRTRSAAVWDRYGLRRRAKGRAAMGKSKHELSALFLYISADVYLAAGGRLGFVITQSLFKNRGASGFRAFRSGNTYLKPIAMNDFVPCSVFAGAANRTATIVVSKDAAAIRLSHPL